MAERDKDVNLPQPYMEHQHPVIPHGRPVDEHGHYYPSQSESESAWRRHMAEDAQNVAEDGYEYDPKPHHAHHHPTTNHYHQGQPQDQHEYGYVGHEYETFT